jgi:hypothetical protein
LRVFILEGQHFLNLNVNQIMQKTSQSIILATLFSFGVAFGEGGTKSTSPSKLMAATAKAEIAEPATVVKSNFKAKNRDINSAKVKVKLNVKQKVKQKSSAGPMQVDQPSVKSSPTRTTKALKAKRAPARGLTAEQKLAFRVRKEKMQSMIALINEKRRAMEAAKPNERAALARELHSMILEREPTSGSINTHARVSSLGEDKIILPPPAIVPSIEAIQPSSEQQFQLEQQEWRDQRLSPQ